MAEIGIPVVVDILGGIDVAIRNQLPKAVRKIQNELSKHALSLKFEIGDGKKSLKDILSDDTLSAKNLATALEDVNRQLERREKSGRFKGGKLSNSDISLIQASSALKTKYDHLTEAEMKNAAATNAVAASNTKAAASIRSTGKSARDTSDYLEKSNNRLITLLKNSARLFAIHTAARFIRSIREVTSEFELQKVALGSIIQDTEYAESLFKKIKAAAIESPFQIKELVTYTKQLSAYQIETEKLFSTTMKLADISAGLGVDMSRLVLAFGQVRAASVLRGQELRQFTEAGIPLVDKLAEKFSELNGRTVKTAEVFDLISKRAVPFSMIEQIFNDMTSAGGSFYQMQEKQAKTLLGQWNNLKDAISIMYDEIGNTRAVHHAMEDLISSARYIMNSWRQIATFVGWAVGQFAALKTVSLFLPTLARNVKLLEKGELAFAKAKLMSNRAVETGNKLIAINAKSMRAYAYYTIKASRSTTQWARSLNRVKAFLAGNWLSLAITAIIGITSAIATLISKSRKAAITNEALRESLENFSKNDEHAREIDNLCNQYDELSRKTSRTEKEQNKLVKISRELSRLYPQHISGIDKQTEAMNVNTEAIRKNNEQAREAIRLSLQQDLDKAEKELNKLTKKRDELSKKSGGYKVQQYVGIVPLSDDEKAEYGKQLLEIEDKIREFEDIIKQTSDKLKGLDGGIIGPIPSAFFGDAWRTQLNDYRALLKSSNSEIKAFTETEIESFSNQKDALDAAAKEYKNQTELVEFYTKALETATGERKKQTENSLADAKAMQTMYGQILTDFNAWGLVKDKSKKAGDTVSKQISDITNAYKKYVELRKYKSKEGALSDIDTIFPSLKGWQPTYENMIAKLEGMLGEYRGDADATRIIRQALANVKFDKIKDDLDTMLQRMADELKRSETARNFYNEILGLTGDQQLATNLSVSIYGDVGKDFAERMQAQLTEAFDELDWDEIAEEDRGGLYDAIIGRDFNKLEEYIDLLPENLRKRVRELAKDNEKYNADWITDIMKRYQKTKTYEQRITDIQNIEAQKRKEISERTDLTPEQKKDWTDASEKKEARDIAEVRREELQSQYAWIKSFEDLDGVSTATLDKMIDLLDEYIKKYGKDLAPEQLRALTRAREQAREQKIQRNAYIEAGNAIGDYVKARKRANELEAEGKQNTDEYLEALDDEKRALKNLNSSINAISNSFSSMSSIFSTISDIIDPRDLSDTKAIIEGISKALTLVGAALTIISAVVTAISANPVTLAISAIVAGLTAIFTIASSRRMNRLNREIRDQTRLIEDLEESYENLNKAMDKSFGDEYVYNLNKMLETLEAEYEAYRKQAAAERAKGKKTDEDALRGYEKSARDTLEKMKELRQEASSFFAGSDLASAAESFADAWLSAYEEFGDTAGAIEERMTEMVQNIVKKAALSGIAQAVMADWYSSLADIQDWNAKTVAEKWKEAMALVDPMVQGMNNFASAMQAEGVSLRNTTGQFSGIARNIAGATEESINGLTAGINTQNFYISHIDASVSAILAIMSGGAQGSSEVPAGVSSTDLMIQYMSTLPSIDQNLAELLRKVSSVISPKSAATNTHYIAVK